MSEIENSHPKCGKSKKNGMMWNVASRKYYLRHFFRDQKTRSKMSQIESCGIENQNIWCSLMKNIGHRIFRIPNIRNRKSEHAQSLFWTHTIFGIWIVGIRKCTNRKLKYWFSLFLNILFSEIWHVENWINEIYL